MLTVKIDMAGIRKGAQKAGAMPAQIDRARASAMKSTAWMTQQELRNHVEYGGSGWPPLHPMTTKYRKKYGAAPGWGKTRRGAWNTPLFWLGKFARYRVTADGTIADIDFGKSRAGQPGTMDPQLVAMVKRHEQGEHIRVTPKMRHMFGATRPRGRRGKNAQAGIDYFPLRKSTTQLKIPARPIFKPVWRKVQPKLRGHFEAKFYAAIERYMGRGSKT